MQPAEGVTLTEFFGDGAVRVSGSDQERVAAIEAALVSLDVQLETPRTGTFNACASGDVSGQAHHTLVASSTPAPGHRAPS